MESDFCIKNLDNLLSSIGLSPVYSQEDSLACDECVHFTCNVTAASVDKQVTFSFLLVLVAH